MAAAVTVEQEEALKATLERYPQIEDNSGSSRDMRRYLWAAEQLNNQHLLRTRPWPGNKTGCPHLAADVAQITKQIPAKYMPVKKETVAELLSQTGPSPKAAASTTRRAVTMR